MLNLHIEKKSKEKPQKIMNKKLLLNLVGINEYGISRKIMLFK